MSKKIRIGFLPLTKVNWTNEAMQKQRRDAIEMLSKIPNVEIVGGEDMIETEEQSLKILERFEKDRPDMLVALFTTFALGTIVSLFAKRLNALQSRLDAEAQPGIDLLQCFFVGHY